ncbi:tRNA-binding domain-containing protein, partial [Mycoplasma putrefaciens]
MNNLKFGVFYNEQFDSLLVSFLNEPVMQTSTYNNVVILKNDKDVIGANIFNVSENIKIDQAFCSEKPDVVNYVENVLKDIYPVKQTEQFLIGKIIRCEAIEGTHLHVCDVDLKHEVIQVICGASNARKGLLVVVATSGSW